MIIFDTDILIYCLNNEEKFIKKFEFLSKKYGTPSASIISNIELVSLTNLSPENLTKIDEFLRELFIIPLNNPLIHIAGYIRRVYNLKLGDGIIAATSLYYQAPLFTNNIKDFKKVKELKIVE